MVRPNKIWKIPKSWVFGKIFRDFNFFNFAKGRFFVKSREKNWGKTYYSTTFVKMAKITKNRIRPKYPKTRDARSDRNISAVARDWSTFR